MIDVSPSELLGPHGTPRPLAPIGLDLGEILPEEAEIVRTSSAQIERFGPLSLLPSYPTGGLLTYLSSARFTEALADDTGNIVVTRKELASSVPDGNTVIATSRDPKEVLSAMLERTAALGMFEQLPSYTSPSAKVSPGAHIDSHVYIDDAAEIAPGAVVLANTYVGKGARLLPNSVVGTDGFDVVVRDGTARVVRHAGGVWLGEGVHVGAATCIDKGLWGDFTTIGDGTQIDNLAHIAHAVRCGRRCILAAGVVVSGWTQIGDGVWLGPSTAVNQLLHIGDYAYVGTGSVVRRDLPAYALAYGATARQAGWYCVCRSQLPASTDENTLRCDACGRLYWQEDGSITLLDP